MLLIIKTASKRGISCRKHCVKPITVLNAFEASINLVGL